MHVLLNVFFNWEGFCTSSSTPADMTGRRQNCAQGITRLFCFLYAIDRLVCRSPFWPVPAPSATSALPTAPVHLPRAEDSVLLSSEPTQIRMLLLLGVYVCAHQRSCLFILLARLPAPSVPCHLSTAQTPIHSWSRHHTSSLSALALH